MTTSTEDDSSTFARPPSPSDDGLALVVAWSREPTMRAGELVFIGPDDERVHVLGRSADAPERAGHLRAELTRQRPGEARPAGPLTDTRLSREQLRIERVDAGALAIENIGRRPLFARGRETRQVVVRPGDACSVQGLLVLVCVSRPRVMPATRHLQAERWPAWGKADPWGLVGESRAAWALRDALAFAVEAGGHALVHGPVGSGKGLVGSALAPRQASIDLAGLGPERLRPAALEAEAAHGAEVALVVEGLEHAPEAVVWQLARLMDERAERGARVVATIVGRPEDVPLPVRSRCRHELAVPDLAARIEDVPLILEALARRMLAAHPELAARFAEPDGRPRLGPALIEALLVSPGPGGVHGLEAALWRALRDTSGEWIEAGPGFAEALKPRVEVAAPSPAARPVDDDEPEDEGAVVRPAAVSDLTDAVFQGLASLTRAERIVLQHVALNRTSRQIAKALFVSQRTVQNHRAHICEKLSLRGHNRLLAVAMALRPTLGPPPSG